ncbi:MAG: hemerythrin domain-containing protein [Frankia sp.]
MDGATDGAPVAVPVGMAIKAADRAGPDPVGTTDGGRQTEPAPLAARIAATHDDVRNLLRAALENPDTDVTDPRRGGRAFDALVAAVSAHLSSMRLVLYPRIRRSLPGVRDQVRDLERGAREMASVMRAMEQHLRGDVHRPGESMDELHADLSDLFTAHVDAEAALVDQLEATWSLEEGRYWAGKTDASMRHAPTRPHPHLPRSRWLLGPAVGATARWDHVLDTLEARSVAGRPVRQPGPPGMWGWYLLGRGTSPAETTAPDADSVHQPAAGPASEPGGPAGEPGSALPAGEVPRASEQPPPSS